jgi:uncharacterized lipoprotein
MRLSIASLVAAVAMLAVAGCSGGSEPAESAEKIAASEAKANEAAATWSPQQVDAMRQAMENRREDDGGGGEGNGKK